MQPITSSSQSQDQIATANIINPEENQQPSTVFAHATAPAHGRASASTSIGEQSADRADTPLDTGIVARSITVTQTLPVQSEPLTDAFQLPAGHTYQPYFWLSKLAHRLMAPPLREQTADMQSQVIDQLLMSESAAKQDFQSRLEYRQVDYGFTSLGASGEPEKNYGVFARKPLAKGALLGIFSGIGYFIRREYWTDTHPDGDTEYWHQKFSEEAPDFMSYQRTVIAGLRGKEQTQRTPPKYSIGAGTIDSSNFISIVPDNERYTPMHFINSANKPEEVNTDFDFITVNTGSDNFHIPICVATKEISAGQELLASYFVNPDAKAICRMTQTATEEKTHFNGLLDDYIGTIEELNRRESGRPPISMYVAAPTICVSETISETFRSKGEKRRQPSGMSASGDSVVPQKRGRTGDWNGC